MACFDRAWRQAESGATVPRKSFGQCADAFLASKRPEWSADNFKVWQKSLIVDCAAIRSMPVADVDTEAVLLVLRPIWAKHVTAMRVRGRIEAVLNFAKAHGWRGGENVAAWGGHLALILPERPALAKKHHAAMAYDKIPGFMAALRQRGTVAAEALAFMILTAARRGEVLGATWAEIDLDAKVWTVPAGRMKARRLHRVPLSDQAIAILERMANFKSSRGDLIFPGRLPHRLGGRTILQLLVAYNATAHGMRSAFRDWCGNETNFPREIAEHALAHRAGDSVEVAYRRSDALERRRELMAAWARFCVR